MFVALVAWTMFQPYLASAEPRFRPWALLVHWPAVLVVGGGVLLAAVIAGPVQRGRVAMAVLALVGTVASCAGSVQVLLGWLR